MMRRNPWKVFILCICTLGIYFFFWLYAINKDIRTKYPESTSPGFIEAVVLVAVFLAPGLWCIAFYKLANHIRGFQQHVGHTPPLVSWHVLLTSFVFPPWACMQIQRSLNGMSDGDHA